MTRDFKMVSDAVWKFFEEKYGGTPIKRFYVKGYGYGAEVEATLKEIPVVVLPSIQ